MPNFSPMGWYEADLWAVTRQGFAVEYEIKRTKADYLADARKHSGSKAAKIQEGKGPSRFVYLLHESVECEAPEWAGVERFGESRGRIWLRLERRAPRLHDNKTSVEQVAMMKVAAYWRFWNSRTDLAKEVRRSLERESQAVALIQEISECDDGEKLTKLIERAMAWKRRH